VPPRTPRACCLRMRGLRFDEQKTHNPQRVAKKRASTSPTPSVVITRESG
jgi:hypothetical protein